jgi:hypothetical protein
VRQSEAEQFLVGRPTQECTSVQAIRRLAPYVLLAIAAGLLSAFPAAGAPSPSVTATQAQAREVLGELNTLNASLDRSDELVNLANLRLASVKRDIATNRRELAIAKHDLLVSRLMIAKRLVTIYTNGSSSTLEVILGAHNLQDVLNRIDTENRPPRSTRRSLRRSRTSANRSCSSGLRLRARTHRCGGSSPNAPDNGRRSRPGSASAASCSTH